MQKYIKSWFFTIFCLLMLWGTVCNRAAAIESKKITQPNENIYTTGAIKLTKNEKLLYFQCIGEPEKIIIFDSTDESFSFCMINSDKDISSMHTDTNGNLLVETYDKKDKKELFYIKKDSLKQSIKLAS